jgi:hypothetical protein
MAMRYVDSQWDPLSLPNSRCRFRLAYRSQHNEQDHFLICTKLVQPCTTPLELEHPAVIFGPQRGSEVREKLRRGTESKVLT